MKERIRVKAKSLPIADVVALDVITSHDLPVQRILDGARDHDLTMVVVLGYTPDGDTYFASSTPDGPEVMWLLTSLQRRLLAAAESVPVREPVAGSQVIPFPSRPRGSTDEHF